MFVLRLGQTSLTATVLVILPAETMGRVMVSSRYACHRRPDSAVARAVVASARLFDDCTPSAPIENIATANVAVSAMNIIASIAAAPRRDFIFRPYMSNLLTQTHLRAKRIQTFLAPTP